MESGTELKVLDDESESELCSLCASITTACFPVFKLDLPLLLGEIEAAAKFVSALVFGTPLRFPGSSLLDGVVGFELSVDAEPGFLCRRVLDDGPTIGAETLRTPLALILLIGTGSR